MLKLGLSRFNYLGIFRLIPRKKMIAEQENQEHKLALMKQEMEIIKRMSKIKHKIAVMSGKGGVGKSTVSVNIAAAFAKRVTKQVSWMPIFTAPMYPKCLELKEKNLKFDKEGIIPVETKEGIKVMSIGFYYPLKRLLLSGEVLLKLVR